jgi:hypothetical protein
MRFMSVVMATPQHYGQPTPELMDAIGKLSEREIKAGRMIDSGGLMPIEQGVRVAVRSGKVDVVDGPFTETKEIIGGYAIFELKDIDEARALAVEFMQLHVEHMPGWEGTCEVREFAPPGCG